MALLMLMGPMGDDGDLKKLFGRGSEMKPRQSDDSKDVQDKDVEADADTGDAIDKDADGGDK